MTKVSSIPNIVNLGEKSVASTTASSEFSVQIDRVTTFLQILFATLNMTETENC